MNETLSVWVAGARPRTLPAAVAPILAGSAGAAALGQYDWLAAALCLLAALALQVGVNYANDYSDGIRGTDEARVGPVRLVGQRLGAALGGVGSQRLQRVGLGVPNSVRRLDIDATILAHDNTASPDRLADRRARHPFPLGVFGFRASGHCVLNSRCVNGVKSG